MGQRTSEEGDDADREGASTDDDTDGFDADADGAAFRAVFRGSFDAMVVADGEGRYVEANPAACELFGLPRDELLGRSIADFAPEEFDFEDAWRTFTEGKNERGLFPLVRPDGERRTVEYSATREVLPGRHLSILRDVTAREANERRLRRQRDELDTLNRINELVRETIDDVVEARTRESIERTVCATIADSDLYAFALVGEWDRRKEGVAVRTHVGVDADWVDRLDRLEPDAAAEGPGLAAMRTDSIQFLDAEDLASLPDPASDVLRDGGARALLVAPLSFGAVGYGFLAIGATRADAFGEREVEGFSALANAVGFAISAVETKQTLSADETTVLEVDVDDPGSPVARLAGEAGGPLAVESLLPLEDGSALVYARTEAGSIERLAPPAAEVDGIEHVRVVERTGGGTLLEVVEAGRTPVHALRDLGARVRDATVDADGTWRLVIALASDRDVRSVVDALAETYPAVTLQSKGPERRRSEPEGDPDPFDRFTARQRTVLEAAYQSGYYDWPRRGNSAEELAETLGIAPQTLLEHLRKAERIAMEGLFRDR